jgi:hypothetical protein
MSDAATKSYVSMFRNAGVAGNPCDEWEIAELQRQLGVKLPPAYKAFLTLAGQGFAPLQGSHYVSRRMGLSKAISREEFENGAAFRPQNLQFR